MKTRLAPRALVPRRLSTSMLDSCGYWALSFRESLDPISQVRFDAVLGLVLVLEVQTAKNFKTAKEHGMTAGGRFTGRLGRGAWYAMAVVCLAACGGGGGDGLGSSFVNNPPQTPPPSSGWAQGVFPPSSQFKDQCANPRTGTADRPGSVLAENNWLRSWTNELYLWYDEVVDRDPGLYSNPLTYFGLLKTTQKTPSGQDKDKFHFTVPTAEWEAFSQSGVTAGYGALFLIFAGAPPRDVRVALVEANSPAANAGLRRGDEIVTIDGVDVRFGNNVAVLNAGLFPAGANETHTFQIRRGSTIFNTTMQSANVQSAPVHTVEVLATPSGPVGYILFNDHIATAEGALIDAINTLATANVVDLVLDVRYNGGGYLAIASQLAYMIAGTPNTAGRVFERSVWNDKHPTTDPVTGQPLEPMPFFTITLGFSEPPGTALPSLNLNRVFLLTSRDTCSASEAIMNGLRGVGVEVIQIGTTTCGKPYGFYPFDNCGTTYFSVQFKGVNDANFGDYTDGFSPSNTQFNRGEPVPGCSINDDLTHELGDANERMLSVALDYRMSGQCSLPPAGLGQLKPSGAAEEPKVARPAYREIRLMHNTSL